MSAKDNGGPAFSFGQTDPVSGQLVNGWGSEGMSLRDYFAAKAMAGLLASCADSESYKPTDLAEISYEIADAMLEARK